jgi:hypothetical protein
VRSLRSPRTQAGFGVIDTILGVFLSFVLVAPVLAGVFMVLRVAPNGSGDSALSQQRAASARNLEIAALAAQMRRDWDRADIIKAYNPPPSFVDTVAKAETFKVDNFGFGSGYDCVGDGAAAGEVPGRPNYILSSGVQWLASLQIVSPAGASSPGANPRGFEATGIDGFRAKDNEEPFGMYRQVGSAQLREQASPLQSDGIGLTRVVYNLVETTSGAGVFDLVRRECAVEIGGLPSVDNNGSLGDPGTMPSDRQGWRLKPGSASAGADRSASVGGELVVWDNRAPHVVLTGITDVQLRNPLDRESSERVVCNDYQDTSDNVAEMRDDYSRCDLLIEFTFAEGAPAQLQLYQGRGSGSR